jgi:uncharacterized protein (TIGR01319 family)
MHIDLLVAEIGSTTTVVNAFDKINEYDAAGIPSAVFVGQGQSPTSVGQGDVTSGLKGAVENLRINLNAADISWNEMQASSSAAGGLRMSVHGLVYDMTVRAAREAALGAGAIVKFITAGKMRRSDIEKVRELDPNLILIAGGVDYGERETALYNFEQISLSGISAPVIYAGNAENQSDIRAMAAASGIRLYVIENVYPKVDILNVEPARKIIQKAFEEHITHAPGMAKVREMVDGLIIPTPGAVMEAAKLLYENIGDLVVFDVGGATTDVHSVTEGSEEIRRILLSPEPLAKRTVEGDLGVYINLGNIADNVGRDELSKEFPDIGFLIAELKPIPANGREKEFVERLTKEAVLISLKRHAGKLRCNYGPGGRRTIAEGKDLSKVKYIIGTGGALTRLPAGVKILKSIRSQSNGEGLYPQKSAEILIDNDYIMASLGVLSKKYPDAALHLLRKSLRI